MPTVQIDPGSPLTSGRRPVAVKLLLQNDPLTICRLAPDATIPAWAAGAAGFVSITRTPGELSIVCPAGLPPSETQQESGWLAFRVAGPLDFDLTGILASLVGPLADAGISVFSLSTFGTDYVLVKADRAAAAVTALEAAGHSLQRT